MPRGGSAQRRSLLELGLVELVAIVAPELRRDGDAPFAAGRVTLGTQVELGYRCSAALYTTLPGGTPLVVRQHFTHV
jgi:hypothetical protein